MARIFAGLATWTVLVFLAEFAIGLAVAAKHPHDPVLAQTLFNWHMLGGIFLGTLCCVIHIMTMFHFIGSGKEIKEAAEVLGGDTTLADRVKAFKRQTSALATFAPLLTAAAVICGGWAHTDRSMGWVHWSLGIAALALNLYAFPIEYRALKANLDLIREVDKRLKDEVSPSMFRSAS